MSISVRACVQSATHWLRLDVFSARQCEAAGSDNTKYIAVFSKSAFSMWYAAAYGCTEMPNKKAASAGMLTLVCSRKRQVKRSKGMCDV